MGRRRPSFSTVTQPTRPARRRRRVLKTAKAVYIGGRDANSVEGSREGTDGTFGRKSSYIFYGETFELDSSLSYCSPYCSGVQAVKGVIFFGSGDGVQTISI